MPARPRRFPTDPGSRVSAGAAVAGARRASATRRLHNVSVLRRTCLLLAAGAAVLAATGCGADGPPIVVAGAASSIPDTLEREIIETSADADPDGDADGSADGDIDADDGDDGGEAEPSVEAEPAVDVEPVPTVPGTRPQGSIVFAGGVDDGGVAAGPPPMPTTVAVVGDSIALSAEPYVTGALEGLGVDVVVYDAVQNRRMVNGSGAVDSGRNAVRDVVEWGVEPDLWLVALGTNDVGALTGRDAWQIAVDEFMAEIPDDADVVWIDTWVEPLDEHAIDFNDALRDELRTRDDVWVLDWHGRAGEEGLIVADGVHLTEAGRIEFARLVGEGLRFIYD